MRKQYLNLVNFWNNSYSLTEEDKKEIMNIESNFDTKNLSPSEKLYKALLRFKESKNVLDYGCGTGWASIILAKTNNNMVTAVDVAKNSINITNLYKEAFNVSEKINSFLIDDSWLSNVSDNSFDGFFCSNVIDVIPLDMAKKIIENAYRICKKGSYIIFSLNYYIDTKNINAGLIIKGNEIYIDDVLRLISLSDKEWTKIFMNYFKNIELEYFSWPGEEKETRRLFILRKE